MPSRLFNGMIFPLVRFSLSGIIWYQGESNADSPDIYAMEMVNMIDAWRKHFGSPQLTFYWFQLANYKKNRQFPTIILSFSQ